MTDPSQLSDAQLDAQIAQLQGSSNITLPPSTPQVTVQQLPPPPGVNSRGTSFDPTGLSTPELDAQIAALLADGNPKMSAGEDMARSAFGGLQQGLAGLATAPHGLADAGQGLIQRGLDYLTQHGVGDASTNKAPDLSRWMSGGPISTPLVQAGLDFAAQHGIGPAIKLPTDGPQTAGEMVQGLVGQGASKMGIDPALAQTFASTAGASNPLMAFAGPSPQQAAQALNGGIPVHTPQTVAGDYTQRAMEFAPMLATPGSAPMRLARMLASGVGSQAAQDIAPDGLKPVAAMLGALIGGGAAEAGGKFGMAPQASFGAAMGNLSADQVQSVQALRQAALQRGYDMPVTEAVQQVTNNGTGLGRLQRVVEGTKQGQALMAPYFANRPSQVSGMVSNFADQIAPPTTQPSMIGINARNAATTALDRARQTINGIVKPDYDALANQPMDVEPQAALMAQPSYQIALKALRGDLELGPSIAGLPDNSVAVVNAVKQRLGTMGEQAKGTPMAPGDNQLAAVRFGAKALADQLAREASPNYANANDTVADLSQRYVDPLKAGPLGAMSQTADVRANAGAMFPAAPLEGAPSETGQAMRILGQVAPGVGEDLTRQHIMNALNQSMKGPRGDMGRGYEGGQNQYAGAALAQALAGNPEQAATLRAGVSALPGGDAHASELGTMLDILGSGAKRQAPGSMTAFNAQDLKDLHIAPFAQAIGRIGDPLTWGAGIGDIINRANYARNTSKLAQMIMAAPEDTAAVLTKAQKAAKGGVSPLLPALLAQPEARH